MKLTKQEWNAAVCLGCIAGTAIAVGAWGAALALARLERTAPGAGWATAGFAMLALYAFLRRLSRDLRAARRGRRALPCEREGGTCN